MNSSPSPYLKRDRSQSTPARDEHDLLVLDVHALDLADALRERRTARAPRTARSCRSRAPAPRSAAGSGTPRSSSRSRTSARSRSPRRRGRRRRARRPRRSSRTARRRRSARRRPTGPARRRSRRARAARRRCHASSSANCCSPSIVARQLVRALGMGMGERHRHVEVGHARPQAASKIGSLKRGSQAFRTASGRARPISATSSAALGGVDALGAEAVGLAEPLDHRVRALEGDVGHHDPLEDGPSLRDRRERRPNAAGAHHQDPHVLSVTQIGSTARPKRVPPYAGADIAAAPGSNPGCAWQQTPPVCSSANGEHAH